MRKTILWIIVIVAVVVAGYFFFGQNTASPPASTANAPAQTQSSAMQNSPSQTPDQGATTVSNPNAPKGSSAACAQCNQYQGAQKAECLVALNC